MNTCLIDIPCAVGNLLSRVVNPVSNGPRKRDVYWRSFIRMQACGSGATILRRLLENVHSKLKRGSCDKSSDDIVAKLGSGNGLDEIPACSGHGAIRGTKLEFWKNMFGLRPGTLGAMMHDDQAKLHIGSGTSL